MIGYISTKKPVEPTFHGLFLFLLFTLLFTLFSTLPKSRARAVLHIVPGCIGPVLYTGAYKKGLRCM